MPRAAGMGLLALTLALTVAGSLPVSAAAPSPLEGVARPSLQALIDTAPPGAEVVVRGVYYGGIVIRKPLRLTGTEGAVIDAGGRGTVVRVEGPGVVLSRLTVRGSGRELNDEDAGIYVGASGALLEDLALEDVLFGINLKAAHDAVIRRVAITGKDLPVGRRGDGVRLWYSHRVTISHLRIDRLRDVLVWFSDESAIHRLEVRGSRYGVHLMYAHRMRITDSIFEDNAVGAYVMYSRGVRLEDNRFLRHRGMSGVGVAFKESDDVLARGNLIAGNHIGLYLDGTPYRLDAGGEIMRNTLAGNDTGIVLLSSATRNVIAGNRFDSNLRQVRVQGGGRAENVWQRSGRGNYWSDYTALDGDGDGDGIGDLPYRAVEWFESLEDRLPAAGFFRGSLAVAAVDFASRLLPLFAPHVLMEDPRPVMNAPLPPAHSAQTGSMLFGLAALLAAAAGLVVWPLTSRISRRSRAA